MFRLLLFFLITGCDPNISTFSKDSVGLYERHTYSQKSWKNNDFGVFPSKDHQNLSKKYKPKLLFSPKGLAPIDFYIDYLPNTILVSTALDISIASPSKLLLKSMERKMGMHLDLIEGLSWKSAEETEEIFIPLYGTIHEEILRPSALLSSKIDTSIPVIILGYRLVFPYSGLPSVLKEPTNQILPLLGNPEKWHELDIHGAIFLIVEKGTKKPISVVLSQHNHFRSYVVGADIKPITEEMPLCVSFSFRSNEPYICPDILIDQPVRFPTSGNPSNFRYIFQQSDEPIYGSYDLVFGEGSGGLELKSDLQVLSNRDPLLVSWIPLGEPKKLAGIIKSISRTGPPGMLINTWPGNPMISELAQIFYFLPDDQISLKISEDALESGVEYWQKVAMNSNGRNFWGKLLSARSGYFN